MANSVSATHADSPGAWARGRSWRVPVRDLPWRRLPAILPIAIALWIFALWGFGRFIASPAPPPEPKPLDTRIIELPPDPPPAPPPPAPVVKPPPAPPVLHKAPPPPPQPRLAPAPKPQETAPTPSPEPPPPPPPAPAAPAPQAAPAPPPPAPSNASPGEGRSGAYTITRQDPKIPDDLADDAARYTVTVRIKIAADGSTTVELDPPTPNPRLNRLYLEAYKAWKWFPATQSGQPVASVQSFRIKPVVN
ncbi:MAG TPA: hypothetical protein VGN52_24580 [Burkholderiales bacterium]|jgi:protein TonB